MKKIEIEGSGVDYERYAMNLLFKKFVNDYKINSVLELPAKGEKAMPSIYSLHFLLYRFDSQPNLLMYHLDSHLDQYKLLLVHR